MPRILFSANLAIWLLIAPNQSWGAWHTHLILRPFIASSLCVAIIGTIAALSQRPLSLFICAAAGWTYAAMLGYIALPFLLFDPAEDGGHIGADFWQFTFKDSGAKWFILLQLVALVLVPTLRCCVGNCSSENSKLDAKPLRP